jgi:hypothetical protein
VSRDPKSLNDAMDSKPIKKKKLKKVARINAMI